jgi:hypothetical protein
MRTVTVLLTLALSGCAKFFLCGFCAVPEWHPKNPLTTLVEDQKLEMLRSAARIWRPIINRSSQPYQVPLSVASNRGYSEAAKILLDNGADPDIEDGYPLRRAIERCDVPLVDVLLSAGASLTLPFGGFSPLREVGRCPTREAEDGLRSLLLRRGATWQM